ncbi:hypothetical protein FBU59_000949 [Linderina macrospora]|uniref:Uncharacterized protein n=1 Tax=Linderina macrospora TaxID=4868 RepID=A0ACC1JFF2_9FUNG|nr:hypothetical protein FBU59_000949 [Linderina macrospora]
MPVPSGDGSFSTQSPTFKWISNMPAIQRARYEGKTRRLLISMLGGYQCPLMLLEKLRLFRADSAVWSSIAALEVHGLGVFAGSTLLPLEEQTTLVRETCAFFDQHFPGIKSVKCRTSSDEWAPHDEQGNMSFQSLRLYLELQSQYMGQATAVELMPPLRNGEYPPVGEGVKHIKIHFGVLDPETEVSVPQLPTDNLETLEVANIYEDMTWEGFTHTEDNKICFDRLTTLGFHFSITPGQEIQPVPYEFHGFTVRLPVLDKLLVEYSTYLYTNFHAIFGSPRLSSLRIVEDHRLLWNVDASVIRYVKSLTIIAAAPPRLFGLQPIKSQAAHLFSAYSEVEEVTITGARFSMPDLINWPNTRRLAIAMHIVSYADIVKILMMLPCLEHLRIWCSSMSCVDSFLYCTPLRGPLPAAMENAADPLTDSGASSSASTSKAGAKGFVPLAGYDIGGNARTDSVIPKNCGLFKFEILSDHYFDEKIVCKIIDELPNLYSVSINESCHDAISEFVATTGRSIDVSTFAPTRH